MSDGTEEEPVPVESAAPTTYDEAEARGFELYQVPQPSLTKASICLPTE